LTLPERFFAGLGRFSVRFRWPLIIAWIAIAIITSIALPSMGSEVNNDNSQFLPSSAPSVRAADLATPLIGSVSRQSQVIVVASVNGRQAAGGTSAHLSASDVSAINDVVTQIRAIPGVTEARVVGVSTDGQAAQILVTTDVGQQNIQDQQPIVNSIEKVCKDASSNPANAAAGLSFHVAGPIATNVANQASSNKTSNQVQAFSLLFIIILLLLIFRSLLAPLITLAPAGIALVISMRLIGALGAHTGLKISEITELLLIVLMLGAGTDYGLFLVFRTREELRANLAPKDAVAHAMARVGESISASAATVIFALLTLLLASFGLYHDLGVPLALGIAVMLLAGLTLLPALLAVFGKAAFWPSKHIRPPAPGEVEKDGWWGRVAARLVARPAITLAVGLVVFVGLSFAALGYYSSGFAGALTAPAGSDAATGNVLLAKHFPAASANPANLVFRYGQSVWTDATPIAKADASLRSSGLFSQLAGPLNPNGTPLPPARLEELHAKLGPPADLPLVEPASLQSTVPPAEYNAYRSLVQFVSTDGQTIQFEASLHAGAQDSTPALRVTPQVRKAVDEAATASGATASGVAGEAAAIYDVSSTSNHDLVTIIPIAILAIGILLALVLRSLVAPLYLIVSVGLSYLAALGLSTILFIDIGGSAGITFILPFLMFIFLLALGEDYNILVMTRIREEARHTELRTAVIRAIGRTGPTVTSAGMVLAGTFAVLAFSAGGGPSGKQIRDVGFGLAIGILMDTFLVRTLLVPSTVALLGRWNWWPSRLAMEPEEPPPGGPPEQREGALAGPRG
jgi:putative drug exporter of the RND superfamily